MPNSAGSTSPVPRPEDTPAATRPDPWAAVRRRGAAFVARPYWDPGLPALVVRRWPDLTACLTALFFFWLSLTPSLVPRPWYYQGVIGGITAAIGYGIGATLSGLFRLLFAWRPPPAVRARSWLSLYLITPPLVILLLSQSADMQRELRRLQALPPTLTWHSLMIALMSLGVAALLVAIARSVRLGTRVLTRLLHRFVPWPVAVGLALSLSSIIVVFGTRDVVFERGVLSVADRVAAAKDRSTDEGVLRPFSPLLSGSPDSLVSWEELGNKGRSFTGGALSGEEIARFNGRPAQTPVRVYVGRAAYDDYAAGARLAVRELERTGAFDRSVLAVAGTTGTGWINPTTVEALEFMHGGDTAVVTMQYSYLPSWASFVVDREEAGRATRALVDAVHARWEREPADSRPKLVVFGESMGAQAVEAAFDDMDDLLARTDGALLVGPPDGSPVHREVTRDRDPASPVWRPLYRDGAHVRFAQFPERDLRLGAADWEHPRVVYLQNASDPVVWWSPSLMFQRPEWLREPLGPDVTEAIDWFALVTFWQTTVDMAVSYGAPAPHGHRYGSNPVDAWEAVIPPAEWHAADTGRLKALLELRHPPRSGFTGKPE
ncbi:alpha/beta hydrolase [Streptomyces bohaiensis]|uniref:alpha/beta hydrolase n=1 Tax=Streptomyces bohaiensis TaxID=1431344 RepID=UPI003B7DCABB